MLESTIALLGGLGLSALTLLMSACIAGSIVAALRGISRGSTIEYDKKRISGLPEVTATAGGNHDIPQK